MAWLELPWRSFEEGLIGLLVCHHFFACSQVEPFSQRIYAFKYILVLLLLLSPITERNLREMNDAQVLAYGILHGSRIHEFVHISIYMNFIAVSWLQLAGILSPQINICNRCDS